MEYRENRWPRSFRVKDETHLLPVFWAVPSAHEPWGHSLSSCGHWYTTCLLLSLPFVHYLPHFSSYQHANTGPGRSFPDFLPAVPSPSPNFTHRSCLINICPLVPEVFVHCHLVQLTSGPQSHAQIPKLKVVGQTRHGKAVLGSDPSSAIYSAREPALTLC